ncbi:MAG: preprotein translocase subunit SecG [Castellaniella sp.]|uniref:preprotein translocase subunit SecG n=1 Tax=Castellaniella sp. TaxID=1955812 RepID=UPI002A360855|nr:preprotein translocase subunit SecG [Castellaniella sp.]MDY0309969.1 preprotein translocase subunit SecG [Castellaniella sp.]
MQWLSSILLTLQVISSLLVIVLVLLQQGKGADMGAAFGSGSAGSVFGSAGAANFLSRATKWAAIVFFATTAGLAWVAHHPAGSPIESGIMQGFTAPANDAAPAGSAVPDVSSGNAVPSVPAVPSSTTDSSVPAVAAPAAGDAAVPSVPAPTEKK